jgi:G:T-mismatch repair DNA endonuclease (very short patch repair protein)
MSEEKQYDLGTSAKNLGKLYPVLKDAQGNVIDGFHRQNADPSWPSIIVGTVDNPKKLELARLAANFCRRQISPSEFQNKIIFLIGKCGMKPEEIAEQTGISKTTIYKYMPQELKNRELSEAQKRGHEEKKGFPPAETLLVECERCHVHSRNGKVWHNHHLCEKCFGRAEAAPETYDGYFHYLERKNHGKTPQVVKPAHFDGYAEKQAHMKVQHSKAEMSLLQELAARGLTPQTDIQIPLRITIPDGVYPDRKIAYYVHGEPHDSGKALEKDEEIVAGLQRLGWTVLTFRHGEGSVKEWAEQVATALKF